MKELMEFPVIYTFKAMGTNDRKFVNDIKRVFDSKTIDSLIEKPSSKGTYISVSVTTEVADYEELQQIYMSIKNVAGLKYHL